MIALIVLRRNLAVILIVGAASSKARAAAKRSNPVPGTARHLNLVLTARGGTIAFRGSGACTFDQHTSMLHATRRRSRLGSQGGPQANGEA